MKRVAREENKVVVRIPPLVGLSVVPIKLPLRIVRVQVEHVRVAVAVDNVYKTICATADLCALPKVPLYIIWYLVQ